MERNDRQLIAASLSGDTASFGVLYDQYIERIYRFVYGKTHHKETAEDVASLVFIKALEQLSSFREEKGSFATWLYAIARNAVTDHYRRESKLRQVPIDDLWDLPGKDDTARSAEERLCVERLNLWMQNFSPDERDVLMLRIWQGLAHKDIARIIGKTEVNCKKIYSRAIHKLHDRMNEI